MNILDRSVTERQCNDSFRFPRQLAAIEIGAHDGGVYQEMSPNPLREPHRYPKTSGTISGPSEAHLWFGRDTVKWNWPTTARVWNIGAAAFVYNL
jgi:hypothetical protein